MHKNVNTTNNLRTTDIGSDRCYVKCYNINKQRVNGNAR